MGLSLCSFHGGEDVVFPYAATVVSVVHGDGEFRVSEVVSRKLRRIVWPAFTSTVSSLRSEFQLRAEGGECSS